MHIALQSLPNFEKYIYIDHGENALFNYNAKFIQQVLRAEGDFEYRLKKLIRRVSKIVGDTPSFENTTFIMDFVNSLYRVLLGREADKAGFDSAVKRLTSDHRTLEEEMRSCIQSAEFRENIGKFLTGKVFTK